MPAYGRWRAMARRAGVAFASACAVAAAGAAGSISLSPIRVDLGPGQRSVALTVRNDGAHATLVQAQLVAWSQAGDDDVLEATADLIVSPPIFTIAPGTEQIVRIA